MTIRYAGIGARETPVPVLLQMETIGALLGARGFTLCSGRAITGADLAFEAGCHKVKGAKFIRTPSCGPLIEGRRIWLDHAERFHPAWDQCNRAARECHARNSAVMLGDYLTEPVAFGVCWTEGGAIVGGTGQALRIAAVYGIPMFNLALPGAEQDMWRWIAENVR